MSLTCEKLLHGHRDGRVVVDKATGEKKRVGQTLEHPYKCARPASRYKVSGFSYSAFATLCKLHRECAEREGFTMEQMEA